MATGENQELVVEWRSLILQKIIALETSQEIIKRDVNEIRVSAAATSVKEAYIKELEARIRTLESFKDKSTTVFLIVQFGLGLGISLITHYWK